MNTLEIAGGWYCDATPEGDYVSTLLSEETVILNGVRVPCDSRPLYVVIADDGSLIAGQWFNPGTGRDELEVYDVDAGAWHRPGILAIGVQPVIYDHFNVIHCSDGNPTIGSQGYRYVTDDNALVTGDETVNDGTALARSLGVHELWGWTALGDVVVGEGQEGIFADVAGRRIKIADGQCRFVQFKRAEDGRLAVAWVRQAPAPAACFLWCTRDDLEAWPTWTAPADPMPIIGRPCWLGWFEFVEPSTLPPGNALLRVTDGGSIRALDGVQIAQWVQRDPHEPDDVAVIEQKAAASAYPPVAYWDGRTWPRWPTLPANAWLGLQMYCLVDETPATFEANMRAMIAAAPTTHPLALVCQCYTNNATLTKDLDGIVPVYARLARDEPRVTMLLVFSDAGRATGLTDHPEVRPVWTELHNGITGTPTQGGTVAVDFDRANERAMTYWAELEVNARSKAIRDQFQRGTHIVGNSPYTGLPWTATEAGDDQAYPAIQKLQAEAFVEIMGRIYWNDAIPLELFYKHGTGLPPAEDVAIHRLSGATVEWKDTVWAMGHEAATITNGMLPPYKPPSDPSHAALCHPPPKPAGHVPDPEPGPITIAILSYDTTVRRGDPNGMLIRFDVSGPPIVRVELSLNDGERPVLIDFPPPYPPDGRYVRALAFKPVVSGTWTLRVGARDDQGHAAAVYGDLPVTVTE